MKRPPRNIPPLGPPRASPRQRILAAWRGYDLAPLENARPAVRSAAELMQKVTQTLRLDRRLGEAELVKVWNDLLAPDIVAHAQPTGIHKGTLFVNVDSSPWLSEIVRFRNKEILERLQHSFGSKLIARISYRLG